MVQTIVVMQARGRSEFASNVYYMGMRSFCEVSCVCSADPKVCNGTDTRYFISTQRLTSARHIRRTSISSANRKTCSDGCSGRVPTSNSNGVATHRPIGLKSVGPRYEFIRAAQLTSYSFPVIDARICDFSGARPMLNQTNLYACPNGEDMSANV